MFDYLKYIMKKVLVYGLGITGISSVKTLSKMGYDVYTYDKNKENIEQLKGYRYSPISKEKSLEENFEFVVKSPGIRPSDELVKKLEKNNEIVSDIELSYRLFPEKKVISITGTNGKTTTTSLISHILNESGRKAISVGNIGEGILWQMYENDCVFVEEISSFQLHDTKKYKSHIAAILNITEDHLDRHGTFEDYKNSKLKIAQNQDQDDFLIINHQDKILIENKKKFNAKIYEFSTFSKVDRGLYLEDSHIKFVEDGKVKDLLDIKELSIVGRHNIENAMVAILSTYLFGLDFEDIIKNCKTFKAIAHRLEFVKTIKGVDFYNDSKATNVDSAIKAIDSFDKNIILIAGGYDKHIDYRPLFEASKGKVKSMVLIGETKEILADLCQEYKIKYYKTDDMKEAVAKIFEIMEEDDTVLLSPASASWDMYNSYAERGDDFKKLLLKYELENL
jgi:UDP-N-acetylmuramoylalanine--D-glutamate ligase